MSERSPDAATEIKRAFSWPTFDDLTTFLLRRIQPRRILDIGCGEGKYAGLVRDAGLQDAQLIGIEYDPYWRQPLLDRGYTEVRTQGGLDLMDKPTEEFDFVILGDVIEHLRKSDGQDLLEYLNYRSAYILVVTPEAMPMSLPNFYEGHNSLWLPESMKWHDHWAHCRSGVMHLYLLRGYLDKGVPPLRQLIEETNAQPFMRNAVPHAVRPRTLHLRSSYSTDPHLSDPTLVNLYRPL